jgi:MoaA/NifB/PqqE/SkfB family radical SAM enzyme
MQIKKTLLKEIFASFVDNIKILCILHTMAIKGIIMVNIPKQDLEKFFEIFLSANIHIMFDTTYYCDMMCPHCHYACTTKSHNFMLEDDIGAILSELNKNNFLISAVGFSGGEITSIEKFNPGYVKRVLSKSLGYGFRTCLMTNGSFVQKNYADRMINDLYHIYTSAGDNFNIQMSFDQYHKNCIPNAHKLIDKLDTKLQNDRGIKYDLYLMGFKHDPDFRDNLTANPKNINVHNKLQYDLNPIGRAKENNLPNCRDTYAEFLKEVNGNKFYEMTFTSLHLVTDGNKYSFNTMIIFDCNGGVRLGDFHNPENYNKFKTQYKKPDGTFKTFNEIHAELATQLIRHFYSNEK